MGLHRLAEVYLDIMANHNAAKAAEVFATDFVCHFGASNESSASLDRAGWVAMVEGWFMAFPDLTPLETMVIVDEQSSRFAVQMRWTATHSGDFMGIPATGKRVENAGVSTFVVRDGAVVEEWVFEDLQNLLLQLQP